jgi:hypothetical protein
MAQQRPPRTRVYAHERRAKTREDPERTAQRLREPEATNQIAIGPKIAKSASRRSACEERRHAIAMRDTCHNIVYG